jgi:hypothetical protein
MKNKMHPFFLDLVPYPQGRGKQKNKINRTDVFPDLPPN